jgi:peptidoglycan hydrolase-like protein with peptidoglycan-binding domain
MRPIFGVPGRRLVTTAAFLASAIFFSFETPARAETKVALIVGNGAYQNVPELPNPPHDAADIAAAFLRLGFSVRLVTDAKYDTMRLALVEFNRKARDAEMAVVFFAGHGMEIGGENWLIPIDAELRSDSDAAQEAISLHAVMLMVSSASKLGLVMLDACRNNPFATKMRRTVAMRGGERGLGRIEPINNVLVAYAAKDGTTAADGDGRNSPFTAALLKYLEMPGLEINFLFRNVRDDVITATNSEQQPFIYGSLTKEAIYLKPPPAASASFDIDQIGWALVKDTTDEAALKRFIAQYPRSPLRKEAEARVAALGAARASGSGPPGADEATWSLLKETTDQTALELFVAQYPNSPLRKDAVARIAALAAAPQPAAGPQLAAVPQAAPAAHATSVDRHELVRSLQLELKRVGCFNGAVNGEFDDATRAASRSFAKLSSITLPDDLTLDNIKALHAIDKRVCPLVCPEGERAEGDHCVVIEVRHQAEPRRAMPRNTERARRETSNAGPARQRINPASVPSEYPAPSSGGCASGLISFCR